MSKILLTGCAGFIGYHSTLCLLEQGHHVSGIDNLNSYYNPKLKNARLERLAIHRNFNFHKTDLSERHSINSIFQDFKPDIVIHLGAQAGVRYSIENPYTYIDSNILGTLTILEGCRHYTPAHLIYASSSSVYGANQKQPFSTDDRTDSPVSLYAATKKSAEMLCESYSNMYNIRATGLRFFTVYGPWGRPDMAYFKFAKSILENRPIDVYNHGRMKRDFTYIDDITTCIQNLANSRTNPSELAHRIYNLGHSTPVELGRMIEILEEELGKTAIKRYVPMQSGDVIETYADITYAQQDLGFETKTSLEEGLSRFCFWLKDFERSATA